MDSIECPGHDGVCVFCKKTDGGLRYVGGSPEIDRLTGEKKVDFCCKSCANNKMNKRKFVERTSIS
jgi:hypothetical protein